MGILIERRTLLGGMAAVLATSMVRSTLAGENLVVIAHESVSQGQFSQQDLAAIFTTRRRNFDDGSRIVPLNYEPRHEHRVYFDRAVLGMTPDEVARYWVDRRVRGGNSPPRHVPSAQLLRKLVEKLPGAIGYVPETMAAGMKIVGRV